MHHIYHTKGIILESKEKGEANAYLTIFTREMGMVYAAAQSVRREKSKLRFALQEFSLSNIDLVRGKDVWRITSASPEENYSALILDENRGQVAQNIFKLIVRLYQGEEANEELFDHVTKSLSILSDKKIPDTDLKHFEMVAVFRILYYLGYLALTGENDVFVRSPIDLRLIEEAARMRTLLLNDINRSLRETQL